MYEDEKLTIEEIQMNCRDNGYTWIVIVSDRFTRIAPVLKVRNVWKKTEVF